MPTGIVCAFVIGDIPNTKNATKNNNKQYLALPFIFIMCIR
jgi:hypothetical protein